MTSLDGTNCPQDKQNVMFALGFPELGKSGNPCHSRYKHKICAGEKT